MKTEQITEDDHLVIRRMVLEPGEATFWHTDSCRRFSVVIRGSRLAIEYRDSGEVHRFEVRPGLAGWDEPESRVHRAVNLGEGAYEEVVTFHRHGREVDPQPRCEP